MRSAPLAQPLSWLAALCLATSASAQTSPWSIGLSESLVHDSNLLKLEGGTAVPQGLSKADLQSITTMFAGLDQPFGRQRLYGTAALRAHRFSSNDLYNHQGYTLSTGLDWSTVEKISGSLTAAAGRSLSRLNDTTTRQLLVRNLESTRQLEATVRLGLAGRYSVEAGLSARSLSNSTAESAVNNIDQHTASAGLRYRPTGASTFGAGVRLTDGRYPKFRALADGSFQVDRFDRRDLDVTARVEPSGLSSVDLRLSLSRASYELATQRDFSGLTGAASWLWRPTGKLRLATTLSRDSGQDGSFNAASDSPNTTGADTSRLTTALGLRVDYDYSAKIGLSGSLGLARRSLARNSTGSAGLASITDDDTTWTMGLGASWAPTRSIRVGCDVQVEERRAGGVLSFDYGGNTFGCRGQITLQ